MTDGTTFIGKLETACGRSGRLWILGHMGHRYRLVWENLRLMVEPYEEHWQAFVYHEKACEVLYRAERMTAHGAKVSVVEFALSHLLGSTHRQDAEGTAERLPWEVVDRSPPV